MTTHELEGNASLRKCKWCLRYFHNEGDFGAENDPCPALQESIADDVRKIIASGLDEGLKARSISVLIKDAR